ncbi:hypothetical protein EAF00_011853 [Botryotinia globosa]|nr:hypothetical protein EAF00_011853 [Botryotinia globosa]
MGYHLLWIQLAKLVIGLKVLYDIDPINLTNHAIKGATYAIYLFIIVFDAIAIFQCVPISDVLKTGPRKSHRFLYNTAVLTWVTVSSIMTDIVIFLIPVPVVWKLNVPSRVKSSWRGMVVCAVCSSVFLRIQHMPDLTYVGGESLRWLQIQPARYLICACLLRCRPLFGEIIETISCRSPKMMESPASRSIPMTSVKIGILEGVADEWTTAANIEVTKMAQVHLGLAS